MSTQVYTTEQQAYAPGFHMAENYVFKSERGLSKKVVEQISEMKGEPGWMRQFRLKSLALFEKRPCPRGALTSRGLTSITSTTTSSQSRSRGKPGTISHQTLRIPLIGWVSRRLSRSTWQA